MPLKLIFLPSTDSDIHLIVHLRTIVTLKLIHEVSSSPNEKVSIDPISACPTCRKKIGGGDENMEMAYIATIIVYIIKIYPANPYTRRQQLEGLQDVKETYFFFKLTDSKEQTES